MIIGWDEITRTDGTMIAGGCGKCTATGCTGCSGYLNYTHSIEETEEIEPVSQDSEFWLEVEEPEITKRVLVRINPRKLPDRFL